MLQSPPPGAHALSRAGDPCRGNLLGARKHTIAALAVAIALLTILPGAAACDGDHPSGGGARPAGHGDGDSLFPRLPKITGHIDQVQPDPDNPRHFQLLSVTDSQGRRWEFVSKGWVGVSVGHLKDHQIHGTTVQVWYEKQPGGINVARFVGD